MRNAFSIIELLITCAILAIVAGLGVAAYGVLSKNVQLAASNHDQAALQQVMEAFHMMGGNLAAITNSGGVDSVKAAALSGLLQNSVSSDSRVQKGAVSNLLSSNLVIVTYGEPGTPDDGRSRLVVSNAAQGTFAVATSGTGFIAVNKTSALASHATVDTSSSLYTSAVQPNLTGAKYASGEAYVWNEDTTVKTAPITTGGNDPTPLTPSAAKTYFYSADMPAANPSLWDYIGGTAVTVHLSLKKNGVATDLTAIDPSVTVTVMLGTITYSLPATSWITETLPSGIKGLKHPVVLNSILPASSWAAANYDLAVNATSSDATYAVSSSGTVNETISPTKISTLLDANSYTPTRTALAATDTFASGDYVEFTASADATHTLTSDMVALATDSSVSLPTGFSTGRLGTKGSALDLPITYSN
jgi:Tfp pilus assembly protein PilE